MLETLENLLKEYQKNLQKISARATARALLQAKAAIVNKATQSGTKEAKIAKVSISSATSGLQESVKGQFGKKVIQILKEEEKMVDNL